jgi:hypothetical protein
VQTRTPPRIGVHPVSYPKTTKSCVGTCPVRSN